MFPNKVTLDYPQGPKVYIPRVTVPPPVGDLFQLSGDEQLSEYSFKSRTDPDSGWAGFPCTPSVFRFYKAMVDKQGDFRVDISPLLSAFLRLNQQISIDDPKARYFFGPTTAMFNNTGYPMQAYITMSGNKFRGRLITSQWLQFETLTPSSAVAGMTYETHPHLIHRFDLVCWDRTTKTTSHKPTTPQGIIYYFLCTQEGVGYIPARYVRKAS